MNSFYLNPKNWFLSGVDKEIAKARATKSGEDLARVLADLQSITENDKKLAHLGIDLDYNRITQNEYDKEVATLHGEPYIKVINIDLDQKSPGSGYFELDFNEHFVEYLANSGYGGVEPEEIVDAWFSDLCKNIVMSDLEDENGDPRSFMADSKEGRIIQRLKMDNDTAEYS
jgi:hypothetical protein